MADRAMSGKMDVEWLRTVCLSLPHTTEQMQWGHDLLFKVHGKMFAITPLEPAAVCLSFKCEDEEFAELTERPGVLPAPYLARAKWVALETPEAIGRAELAALLKKSHELVFAKLPRRLREGGAKAKKSLGSKQGEAAARKKTKRSERNRKSKR